MKNIEYFIKKIELREKIRIKKEELERKKKEENELKLRVNFIKNKSFQINKIFTEKIKKYKVKDYPGSEEIYKFYSKFWNHINIDYSVEDIIDFVKMGEHNLVKGIFSGMLVSILTNFNQSKKIRTTLEFNGEGNLYNYLFYGLNCVDELIVKNLRGKECCSYSASNGNIQEAFFENIKGSECGNRIGKSGYIGKIYFKSIKGDYCAEHLASHNGSSNLINFENVVGERCGTYIGSNEGNVETIRFNNIEEEFCGAYIAINKGKVKSIYYQNIVGRNCGEFVGGSKGFCNLIDLKNVQGDDCCIYTGCNEGKINEIIYSNVSDLSPNVENIGKITRR